MSSVSSVSKNTSLEELYDLVRWNQHGLIPAVVQDVNSGEVLMHAWMNRESLELSIHEQRGIYWSRSRQTLWRKGETSGNIQRLCELRLDCDMDTLLLRVEQTGPACHTGSRHCFVYMVDESGCHRQEISAP